MENKEVKKSITLKSVLAWILGILILILGITNISHSITAGLFFIVSSVIMLPVTYGILSKKFKFKFSIILRSFLVLLFFIIALITLGVRGDNGDYSHKTLDNIEKQILEVSATKLHSDYEKNTIAADSIYKDKVLHISGVVDSIGKDIVDQPYVTLKGDPSSIFGVQCMFDYEDESSLININKNQNIKLSGEVSGEMIGNIIVTNCKIIN